jgi:hypothetical protein
MKMDRKRLIREYKERPKPMGVFRVTNRAEQRSLVGSSVDAPAALNRERFQLKAGLHPNAALQADWNRLGAEAFEFELLDSLDPSDRSDADRAEDLAVLERLWLEKLSPYGARGYNTEPKGE